MPMLISNPTTIPKSMENISRSGVDIDEAVRKSFSCAVRNSLSKFSKNTVDCITKIDRKSRKNDKNSKLSKIATSSLKSKNFRVTIQPSVLKKNIKKEVDEDAENSKTERLNNDLCRLDDSLTNLQWLTDVRVNDILDGKPLPYAPLSPAPSNSSEDGEEAKCVKREPRHFSDSSIDYRNNRDLKPPYSYAALIIMAMKSKSCAKMTLSEIYKWITDNFSFYKHADPSWQNSIRHNLSLNKCFAKIPRNKGDPGKGGYWRIVPEFANKLLESNIRKRRSSMMDFNCHDIIKRQRLDIFENQLLCKIKPEIKTENNNASANFLSKATLARVSNRSTPIQADLEHCRMDHPYGKNPYVKYDPADEENIRALANNLRQTVSNVEIGSVSTAVNSDGLSSSQVFNTFSSAIRTDCIWSSQLVQADNLTESMSKVTEELLEARNHSSTSDFLSKTLVNSLNSSGSLIPSPFCLSPPLSGDDDCFSDDLDEFDDAPPDFTDDINLTIRGTSMTLLQPTPELIASGYFEIKEEPVSPGRIECEE
ncbi:uncharacterized protein LOC130648895 [Hydractinia symbiolongicarpus]|uniref:uncharacterized protein LOC130648895 n=1 Tax=Hydractinia symbiolongicarpus TaxID=13093 RepID=UPI00254CFD07|nr:uncharacterized protein LOC130648895 [Hydractinia symbiolongicarpus]XP_057311006.1 uncharacterized protein LOC130648895 [Hydractinia symbiolongicarpus]